MNSEPSIHALIQGGLGNQLFIIASLLGISSKLSIPCLIQPIHTPGITQRPSYWKTIFHKLTYTQEVPSSYMLINEQDSNILLNVDHFPKHYPLKLVGYFQSSYYFKHIRSTLLDLFQLPPPEKIMVHHHWEQLTQHHNGPTIFLHVRRGDYLSLPHVFFVLSAEWYQRAVSHFSPDSLFLIFSEDHEWCLENMTFIKNYQFVQHTDFIDLFLMSQCDGGIIANSSFSWWGAYLNQKPNTRFVCPDIWLQDRVPQRYIRNELNWIEEKVRLTNTTQ